MSEDVEVHAGMAEAAIYIYQQVSTFDTPWAPEMGSPGGHCWCPKVSQVLHKFSYQYQPPIFFSFP